MEKSFNPNWDKIHNNFAELWIRDKGCGAFSDQNQILWKIVDNKFTGKRMVQLLDNRVCWIEDTSPDNIKTYSHGKDADYTECFYNN